MSGRIEITGRSLFMAILLTGDTGVILDGNSTPLLECTDHDSVLFLIAKSAGFGT